VPSEEGISPKNVDILRTYSKEQLTSQILSADWDRHMKRWNKEKQKPGFQSSLSIQIAELTLHLYAGSLYVVQPSSSTSLLWDAAFLLNPSHLMFD